jgi:zinc transporter 1
MKNSRSLKLGIQLGLTFGFFLVELIVGSIVNSLALVSDAFHMLSDVLALGVAFYAIRLSKRDSTAQMSYGWARAEIVGAFANAVFLIALCFTIIIDAIQRLVEPEGVRDPLLLLIVGGAGLAINIIGLIFFHEAGHGHSHGHSHSHGHGHSHKKDKHKEKATEEAAIEEIKVATEAIDHAVDKNKNMNMRGVFLHVLGDALGSVAVIIVGLVLYFVPSWPGSVYLDPVLSLLIVGLLLAGSIPLAKQTSNVLLHRVPGKIDVETVSKELQQVEGVSFIHDFHVWQLSDSMLVASCHVVCDPDTNQMAVVAKMKAVLHTHDIHETAIQIEQPKLDGDIAEGVSETQCLLECEKDCHTKTCRPRKEKKAKKAEV